jgi:hypothetical protein
MMKETKENRIEAVRAFLIAANNQFEAQGIRLERVIFKRDEEGKLSGVRLSYEDTNPDDEKTEEDGQ